MVAREIEQLMKLLAQLPGLGPRSGKRAALHLIKRRSTHMEPLLEALEKVRTAVQTCSTCGNLDTQIPCTLCTNTKRDPSILCIIEDVEDLWAMERSASYRGHYHVLGGAVCLGWCWTRGLSIAPLMKRLEDGNIQEIIIALNATIEGQTTAHYVSEKLAPFHVKITRLAHGLPIGGDLDYLDEGTILPPWKPVNPYDTVHIKSPYKVSLKP